MNHKCFRHVFAEEGLLISFEVLHILINPSNIHRT